MKKFTVIDILIVIVLIAVIAIGGYILVPKMLNNEELKNVECTVLLNDTEKELAEAMKVGDEVTMSLTEKDGGVIKSIEVKPAEKTELNVMSGEYVQQTLDNRVDIYVTVDMKASVTDTSVKVGSTVFKVGAETTLRGKGYAAMGYVIVIND